MSIFDVSEMEERSNCSLLQIESSLLLDPESYFSWTRYSLLIWNKELQNVLNRRRGKETYDLVQIPLMQLLLLHCSSNSVVTLHTSPYMLFWIVLYAPCENNCMVWSRASLGNLKMQFKAWIILVEFQALCTSEELIKLIDTFLLCNANFCSNDLPIAFRLYELLSSMS